MKNWRFMEGQIADSLMEESTGRPVAAYGRRPRRARLPLEAFSFLHDFDRFFDIAQWWWFNPFGSTMCGLRLFDAVELDTRLVTVAQFHERSREITVYAAGQRAKLADLHALAPVIDRVLSRYGWSHAPKFLQHLPVFVFLAASTFGVPRTSLRC